MTSYLNSQHGFAADVVLLDRWSELNTKIETWVVRGAQMQAMRESCQLQHKMQQVTETVQQASKLSRLKLPSLSRKADYLFLPPFTQASSERSSSTSGEFRLYLTGIPFSCHGTDEIGHGFSRHMQSAFSMFFPETL